MVARVVGAPPPAASAAEFAGTRGQGRPSPAGRNGRASFEAYDPLAKPAPAPCGAAASPEAAWHQVSQRETNFNSRFRVSGFGFRVSIGPGEVIVFRVGFGFRASSFGFRVSIGPGEGKSSESVSGFGFRVSGFGFGFRSVLGKLSLQSRFRVSGFGFRWSKPTLQTSLRITSLEIHRNP